MVIAHVIVALPLIAGFTRAAISLLEPDTVLAMRADGAGETRIGRELASGANAQVLVAVAAGFGRAISEVSASLMVGGNIVGQTRVLTTAISLESGRGDFAMAMATRFHPAAAAGLWRERAPGPCYLVGAHAAGEPTGVDPHRRTHE
jgi:tungstate transport system permease protein